MLGLLLAWLPAGGLRAQAERPAGAAGAVGAAPLVLHAYTLKHQPASEALTLIYELLSDRGTVELQPGGNTLVIRDTFQALRRIIPVLASFDHPSRWLRLEIQIVRAGSGAAVPGPGSAPLSAELTRRLRELLRFERFELVASASLRAKEGETVTYRVGDDFAVSFRMGTLLADRRIKLQSFRLAREVAELEPRQLLHTNLNLWLEEPLVLGLARTESSDNALMVVLSLGPGDEAQ